MRSAEHGGWRMALLFGLFGRSSCGKVNLNGQTLCGLLPSQVILPALDHPVSVDLCLHPAHQLYTPTATSVVAKEGGSAMGQSVEGTALTKSTLQTLPSSMPQEVA
jgi:hypothetical protein